jgi:hypothetical protein
MARLKDILQQQRKMNFVGRQKEIEFFSRLLEEEQPATHLLYILAPGGQGKTTLLKQFADTCKTTSVPLIQLDCRYIEPHPDSFKTVFASAATFAAGKEVMETIESMPGKVVLLVDTYEKLKPLDDWLRMDFLPELPGNVITVIASRTALSTNWKTDPGWQGITKILSLKELSEDESMLLLSRRNIPAAQAKQIVDYTRGNALALSIVADMFDQRKEGHFNPMQSPDIMKALLEQFVQEVPSPAHKAALELCSLLYVTTEKIIEEVLGAQMAHELFNWLTSLSIIEKGPAGIFLHDIVRDAVAAEMHWRNPEWYRHLHIRTQQYFVSRVLKSSGERQREIIFNLIYLHRMNPAIKHFFEFQESGSSWQDKLKEEDRPHLLSMVKKYEGKAAADCFSKWLEHDAADTWVFRDAEKTPAGFVLKINLEKITGKTHDETINTLLPYKKEMNIETGQLFSVFRSWMGRDNYQNVSGVQSAIFLGIVQWYFTPGLAISMLHCAHPDFWKEILTYADLHQVKEMDHEQNGQSFGWYMHDWRKRPPLAWLELMGKKEINEAEDELNTTPGITAARITEQDFTDAVYDAMKHLKNPKKITGNPLLAMSFIKKQSGANAAEIDRALTLAEKLTAAIGTLENSPKEETLHRVLYRTFINPVGSQEQTADFLYMSFSTYRRQVKKGVERVADILWMEHSRTD